MAADRLKDSQWTWKETRSRDSEMAASLRHWRASGRWVWRRLVQPEATASSVPQLQIKEKIFRCVRG